MKNWKKWHPKDFFIYHLFSYFSNLGRVDKAQELLTLPWTNVNAQYANGNTPLILAVQGNN